jgi:hypothetical protein
MGPRFLGALVQSDPVVCAEAGGANDGKASAIALTSNVPINGAVREGAFIRMTRPASVHHVRRRACDAGGAGQ